MVPALKGLILHGCVWEVRIHVGYMYVCVVHQTRDLHGSERDTGIGRDKPGLMKRESRKEAEDQ